MVHLGERECSVQRRHQKVIEEAPSPIVETKCGAHGRGAVKAAAAGYFNAGTVEFLVIGKRNFYFLEMNTRLQVEHPVTELVTGLDLVRLQIGSPPAGSFLFRQEDVQLARTAIECRIYAEDPDNNFFPSPGKITQLSRPPVRAFARTAGLRGWKVPLEYDPMLSKLIGYGLTRDGDRSMRGHSRNISSAASKRTFRFFGASWCILISWVRVLIPASLTVFFSVSGPITRE